MKMIKKLIVLVLVAVILGTLAGCRAQDPLTTGTQGDKGEAAASAELLDDSIPRGRFVDTETAFPAEVTNLISWNYVAGTGLMVIGTDVKGNANVWISPDLGDTWAQSEQDYFAAIPEGTGIQAACIADDGTMYLTLGTIDEFYKTSGYAEGPYRHYQTDQQGEMKELQLDEETGQGTVTAVADNGDLFIATDTSLVQIDQATSERKFVYDSEGKRFYIAGKYLYAVSTGDVEKFDIDSGEADVFDSIEAELLSEETVCIDAVRSDGYEDSIYYACSQGVFRVQQGGNLTECIFEGSLSMLSDQDNVLFAFRNIDENTFITLYLDLYGTWHFVRSEYDPDVVTTPQYEITVWALEEDLEGTIQRLITAFQQANPDVRVIYEYARSGLAEEAGTDVMTTTDIIRQLNTEIMADNGPDILILDGLPYESYMEQGLFADLTELAAEVMAEEEMFDQILTAFTYEEQIMALPYLFKMPVIAGKSADLQEMTDLGETVSHVKNRVAGDEALEQVTNADGIRELIYKYLGVYGAEICSDDGLLDERKLAEFLSSCREIYEIQSQLHAAEGLSGEEWERQTEVSGGYLFSEEILAPMKNGKALYAYGYVEQMADLTALYTMEYLGEGITYQPLKADTGYYRTEMAMGINTKSSEQEICQRFLKYMCSEEGQSVNLGTRGIPINKNAVRGQYEAFVTRMANQEISLMDGMVMMDEAYVEQFIDLADTLDTQVFQDELVTDVIGEEAINYLMGYKDLDTAVSDIIQTINLYLAE